jgi:hypothetical protein
MLLQQPTLTSDEGATLLSQCTPEFLQGCLTDAAAPLSSTATPAVSPARHRLEATPTKPLQRVIKDKVLDGTAPYVLVRLDSSLLPPNASSCECAYVPCKRRLQIKDLVVATHGLALGRPSTRSQPATEQDIVFCPRLKCLKGKRKSNTQTAHFEKVQVSDSVQAALQQLDGPEKKLVDELLQSQE